MRNEQEMDMVAEEKALEDETIALGVKRYMEYVQGGSIDLPPHIALTRKYVLAVAPLVQDWLDRSAAGSAARDAWVAQFCNQWSAEELAYVAVRAAMEAIATPQGANSGRPHAATTSSKQIGRMLETMENFEAIKAAQPKLYKQMLETMRKGGRGFRNIILRKRQQAYGIKRIKWGEQEQIKVGFHLLSMVAETGFIDLVKSQEHGKAHAAYVIAPGEGVIEWLQSAHAHSAVSYPPLMPMVIKPRPWTGPFGGGRLNPKLRIPLIKTSHPAYLEELKSVEMPRVYAAVNAMQDTPWRVNEAVFKVAQEVIEHGAMAIEGVAPMRDLPMPPRPAGEPSTHPAEWLKWKKEMSEAYTERYTVVSKRRQTLQIMWVAERMRQYDQFYFVAMLDWRGRVYFQGRGLNPQGNKLSKGLLEFANGVALGDTGEQWLAIHGANSYGIDKVSFEDRQRWVLENEEEIFACATNPMETMFWQRADSPWQFLGFCMEWMGLTLWKQAGNAPEDFISHTPVGLDGTCNGLQNFSAMLLDESDGRATNLVPSSKPADIYARVAQVANEECCDMMERGEQPEFATRWAGKITRKHTKRNTMTVPYGVTFFGMKDQLIETLEELEAPGTWLIKDAIFLAQRNSAAIDRVVGSARRAQAWLQTVATVISKESMPVRWTTPVGLPVLQSYYKTVGKILETTLGGSRVRLTLSQTGTEINKGKQSSGISPNFIHSLDAAHLMSTVEKCAALGMQSFAMIHDSYGTHAGNTEVLAEVLREAFVEQYSVDVLDGLRTEVLQQLPEEKHGDVPSAPERGTLDLEVVKESLYFFS